ncbi:hypothetical protein HanPSC8_Chr01g0002551 [Helianthus annuus]|nr:hypothetical protein HanPSC8_Chr01g0002551 [Helianthus annuus]
MKENKKEFVAICEVGRLQKWLVRTGWRAVAGGPTVVILYTTLYLRVNKDGTVAVFF